MVRTERRRPATWGDESRYGRAAGVVGTIRRRCCIRAFRRNGARGHLARQRGLNPFLSASPLALPPATRGACVRTADFATCSTHSYRGRARWLALWDQAPPGWSQRRGYPRLSAATPTRGNDPGQRYLQGICGEGRRNRMSLKIVVSPVRFRPSPLFLPANRHLLHQAVWASSSAGRPRGFARGRSASRSVVASPPRLDRGIPWFHWKRPPFCTLERAIWIPLASADRLRDSR
jgi:hypothetical protein